jgi:hypothetical protein
MPPLVSVLLPLLFHRDLTLYWMVPLIFRMSLFPLVNPLWKRPHRHTQTCAFLGVSQLNQVDGQY